MKNTGTISATSAIAAIAALVLSGCASMDRPDAQLASARTSIDRAEQSGAREYGAQALDSARENLSLAQRAADRGDNKEALRLATKAELDAELASAQASSQKAETALRELKKSIADLRQEVAVSDRQTP